MSAYARPWFRVWGHGRGKWIRALYREGCNFAEIAATFCLPEQSVRQTLRYKAARL